MLLKNLIIIVFLSLSLYAEGSIVKKEIPEVVPVQWLKEHYNDPRVVILDIREYDEYKKGHLEGAVNVPGLKNLFDAKTWMMPKLDALKDVFSNAGVDKDSLVVAYDNGEFFWAARLYWILEVLGHNNVGLLQYAYGNYLKQNLPISTKDTVVKRKEFVPRVDNNQIQTKLSTLLSIGKKTIIDGRANTHYMGEESISKRFGHIPTAKNYACTNNFQVTKDGSRMKDFDELAKLYKDIPKDKEVILYCQGGAEAALNYIVLKKLGFKASVYDGSWKEWGNDSAVPVDNPSKK
ncbi:MAG: rhodanese-like domain-containing protein [Campylobacterota bacterium]|nr:rhodanese-like domain-containing protein [Campylobacterota bacterium]